MTRHFYMGAVLALGAAACGGEDLVLPSEGEPAAIVLVQGDGQSGRAGESLPQPLVFEVTDATGRPVAGAEVVVELPGAQLAPETATTGSDGRVVVEVVLGATVGTAQGTASVPTPSDRADIVVDFTVGAVAASANGLGVVSGQDQSAPAGAPLAAPLVVQVTDAFGNPIPGVTVAWTAEGGGSLSAEQSTTDENGLASVNRTLGPGAGLQRTFASSDGLAGSPATFLHTATAGSAAGVQIVAGNGQTGPPGSRLPQELVVQVSDGAGNPVSGAAVTWVVTAGGGRVEPATSITGADGRAATEWVLGGQVGANAVQAVVSGVGSATFNATAAAGSASRVEIVSGNDQTAPAGSRLGAALVVRVLDAGGTPVPGATVTWRVRSGGGTVSPSTATTDAAGQASATWTLGAAVGANTVEASASGAPAVTFRATGTVGVAATLALATQPAASARAGVPLDRQPVVQVRDAAGNDVAQAGVTVTAAIASGPGTLGGTVTRVTDAQGRVSFTDLVIGGAIGTHTLIFAASGFASVTSNAIEVRRAPTSTRIVADDPDPSAPGEAVTVRFEVTSEAGTPSGPVTVTTSAGGESCTADATAGSCVLALGSAGAQTLTARYGETALFEASAGDETHTVAAPNAAPVATADAYTTPGAGLPLEVAAPGVLGNDTDGDGDLLAATEVSGPSNGVLELAPSGGFRYTPAPGFLGTDTFTYRASDGQGGVADAVVTITVQ